LILLLAPAVLPLVLGVAAWLVGLFGWSRTRRGLLAAAIIVAYTVAIVPFGDQLLLPLENSYPPLPADALPRVDYVVVLGSGYAPHGGVPITSALDPDGLVRIVEGMRLVRKLGSAKLVVSGGAPAGHSAPAEGYAVLAREFGITDAAMIVLDQGLTTSQEARAVAARLGTTPFLLVTASAHMPRAMLLMKRAGAVPIAAPTAQWTERPRGWESWLPSAAGLGRTERAVHEYLGLAAIGAHLSE
jgi:uncharacterized SAM-binding protein YcdF (DUF218 family)